MGEQRPYLVRAEYPNGQLHGAQVLLVSLNPDPVHCRVMYVSMLAHGRQLVHLSAVGLLKEHSQKKYLFMFNDAIRTSRWWEHSQKRYSYMFNNSLRTSRWFRCSPGQCRSPPGMSAGMEHTCTCPQAQHQCTRKRRTCRLRTSCTARRPLPARACTLHPCTSGGWTGLCSAHRGRRCRAGTARHRTWTARIQCQGRCSLSGSSQEGRPCMGHTPGQGKTTACWSRRTGS